MDRNCFEIIYDTLINSDKLKDFKIEKSKNNTLTLTNSNSSYEINFDPPTSKINLWAKNASGEIKKLSSWLLNTEFSQKDLTMISNDFIETMIGKEQITLKAKKQKNSSDDSNVTGIFFANRMATIFPELKEKIQDEKNSYEEFRSAFFAKNDILPTINNFLKNEKNVSRAKKLGKLISDLYKNATLDVKSIITMAILNGLDESVISKDFEDSLGNELLKSWGYAKKYKNKKVKPEKPKKRKSLLSQALNAQIDK